MQPRLMISLDYELFFGSDTGGYEDCLIEPTNRIVEVLEAHDAKVSLFVDAGYLLRAEAAGDRSLTAGLAAVDRQLNDLSQRGHDIQLHIHPHWEDCSYSDGKWQMSMARYRLHDHPAEARVDIVHRYKARLERVAEQPVFAYRAGGWCLQPFDEIAAALKANGIWLDSTVYEQGYQGDQLRWFDFRDAPDADVWHFSNDPLQVDEQGEFVELPISSVTTSPLFYWQMGLIRKLGAERFRQFGQGTAMRADAGYYVDRLLKWTSAPASVDGIKGRQLDAAFRAHLRRHRDGVFNVMGHPKALTPDSLVQLDSFLNRHGSQLEPVTFQNFHHLQQVAS